MKKNFPFILMLLFAGSCTVSKNYNPVKKYSPQQLKQDYHLFKNILEESHPGLYWYTPKDSIDRYFEIGESKLNDSLPEYKFRNVLSYVLAGLRCGHTTVRASKAAINYAERTRNFSFPLNIKAWDDTVVVTSNMNHNDSVLTRGVVLKSIDGRPMKQIIDTMFKQLSADGYNTTHKYQTLSNPGVFRILYGSLFGLKLKTPVTFIDSSGVLKTVDLHVYIPVVDSSGEKRQMSLPSKKTRRKLVLQSQRNMRIDTTLRAAFMEVNTFGKHNKLRSFFKRSFKELRRKKIQNLVVDMRGNGGGSVMLSNLLTKYIADKPFKIADSLYALKRKSSYGKYEENYFLNRLFFMFLTHKKADGHYHFRYFENRYFKPKTKNHFTGETYILIGGNTFSAATLFAKSLKDQKDVTIVGEETGGGAYGNTAWLIPDVTLPNTKVRFRLPLFRLVIDKNAQKGRGVMPEVEVKPTVDAIRRNADFKLDKVIQLIKENFSK